MAAERHNSGVSWAQWMATMSKIRRAKYAIGQVVRHRVYPFRGVVFDIDPLFSNTEEWYQSIPSEVRPHKDQPYYHLFAENAPQREWTGTTDRKSTRLNSSHANISYAVFCLKKKKH